MTASHSLAGWNSPPSKTWDHKRHELPDGNSFHIGVLPEAQCLDNAQFESLWSMHPADYHVIKMHGKPVKTPRWQQAFGDDYYYTGRVSTALAIPPLLICDSAACGHRRDRRFGPARAERGEPSEKRIVSGGADATLAEGWLFSNLKLQSD
jgi:hypothetical protein